MIRTVVPCGSNSIASQLAVDAPFGAQIMQTSILVGPGRTYVDSVAKASEYSYAVLKMIIVLMM